MKIKREELRRVVSMLENALAAEYSDITRDSVLLRFELASELAWKTLKVFLEDSYHLEIPFPASVYREAGKSGMLAPEEVEIGLMMIQARNRMVHDYNQEWANDLYNAIQKNYIILLRKIITVVSLES